MAQLPYANTDQVAELTRQAGFHEGVPTSNAFRMFVHAPAVGAATFRLIVARFTETELDAKLRESVILRVSERCNGRYASVQDRAN